MKSSLLASILFAALDIAASGDTVIRNYQPAIHDRFYAGIDKAFAGDPYDFSGVGSTGGQWATLISDSHFISATHYHAGNGATVTFWETNDFSGPSHSYTIAGGQQIGGTDLWVGWLNTSVDATIYRYSVLDLPSEADYVGLTLFNYGQPHQVGRNVADFLSVETIGSNTGKVLWYDYDNDDTPSVGGDETYLQGGDSGGPTFTVFGGKLTLLGIHSGITDAFPGTDESEASVDTFVPTYITELNQVLDDNGQWVSVVPEPSAAALALLAALGLLSRARHRPSR